MKIAESRITAQGQISIPAEVRRRLGLQPGAVLEWDADGDRITIRRSGKYSFEDIHQAIFKKAPTPKSDAELKEGIRRRMKDKHARR